MAWFIACVFLPSPVTKPYSKPPSSQPGSSAPLFHSAWASFPGGLLDLFSQISPLWTVSMSQKLQSAATFLFTLHPIFQQQQSQFIEHYCVLVTEISIIFIQTKFNMHSAGFRNKPVYTQRTNVIFSLGLKWLHLFINISLEWIWVNSTFCLYMFSTSGSSQRDQRPLQLPQSHFYCASLSHLFPWWAPTSYELKFKLFRTLL